MNKIKIAFIKFSGMCSGGTEKFLQTIAMCLPKDTFEVTYFYCDTAPYIGSDYKHPGTDQYRLNLMKNSGIKLVEFVVGSKNVTIPTHDWENTNFWNLFNEVDFDIIQTGRAGHPEYPFNKILSTPIVDSVHLPGHVDNQKNISTVIHVSETNKKIWVYNGGEEHKAEVVYLPIQLPRTLSKINFIKKFGIENKFIFGMHQRNNDYIYSHIPLAAYKKIATDNTAFIILGGSKKYEKQASRMNIPSFYQLPETGDMSKVCKFLQSLDVYSHGRSDGENNSQSIAEAMSFAKPIISHFGKINGHVETIGNAGVVVKTVEEYASEMIKLQKEKQYYDLLSLNSINRFKTKYNLQNNINKIVDIYKKVYKENMVYNSSNIWLDEWLD